MRFSEPKLPRSKPATSNSAIVVFGRLLAQDEDADMHQLRLLDDVAAHCLVPMRLEELARAGKPCPSWHTDPEIA